MASPTNRNKVQVAYKASQWRLYPNYPLLMGVSQNGEVPTRIVCSLQIMGLVLLRENYTSLAGSGTNNQLPGVGRVALLRKLQFA